jgi:hypothetical protein
VERILKRNEELEAEVERLRTQVLQARIGNSSASATSPRQQAHIPEAVTLDWMSEAEQHPNPWNGGSLPSHNPAMPSTNESPDAPYTLDDQIYPVETEEYEESEDPRQNFLTTAVPIWHDPMAFEDGARSLTKPSAAWAPFHPALSQPSRFADLQASGFSDVCAFSKQVILIISEKNIPSLLIALRSRSSTHQIHSPQQLRAGSPNLQFMHGRYQLN